MTLCYYITGHGYGHAIRSAQVLKALPPDLPVILRTTVPLRLFSEEVPGREFTQAPAEFDCGCLQSDSITVLPRPTLTRYAEIAAANTAHLAAEVAFLRQNHVRAIVTDIPSFPLRAAQAAGIPGYAVANFTWHDIYREYAETEPDAALLGQMAQEYAAATAAFITPLATATVKDVFPTVIDVPLIARRGRNRREQLARRVMPGSRLALLYLGDWGLALDWAALAQINDWTFLTYAPTPQPVGNVVVLDRGEWPYADVAASVDVVISKAGYGTVTECIANDVPLIYAPRTDFAEYPALVAGMKPWGGGIPLSNSDFRAGRWRDALTAAIAAPRDREAYAVSGAQVVADALAARV